MLQNPIDFLWSSREVLASNTEKRIADAKSIDHFSMPKNLSELAIGMELE